MENRLERVAQVALKLTSRTQAVRLWNWIDRQNDCDALWRVMVEKAPQFFEGDDPNSLFWSELRTEIFADDTLCGFPHDPCTFVRAVRVSNDMEWATMVIHRVGDSLVLRGDREEYKLAGTADSDVQAVLDEHNTDDICWEVC